MTREEAITYLKVIWNRYKAEYEIERETLDAYHMAIEALSVANLKEEFESAEVVSREHHDMEIKELKHQIKDQANMVSVVRCKDCKKRGAFGEKGFCELYARGVPDEHYCSYGERRPSK